MLHARALLNLALLVGVVALAAIAWFEPGKQPPPAAAQLIDMPSEQIHRITIARGTETIRLQQENGVWWLREPCAVRANPQQVTLLLEKLHAQPAASYPVAATDLSQLGFADPPLIITLNDTLTLTFGDTTPLDYQRYVRRDDKILLLRAVDYYPLNRAPEEFASLALLPPQAAITALALPGQRLEKTATGWKLTPEKPAIATDAIQKLLAAWQQARAIDVAPLADDAKIQDEVTIILAGEKQPLRFSILASDTSLLLGRSDIGLQYSLPKSRTADMLQLIPPAQTPEPNTSESLK